MTVNHGFTLSLPPPQYNPCRPYFEMFYYLLNVAMGIRVQFLAEECSELPPAVGGALGGGSTPSTGMDALSSLLCKLSDSSLEPTNHSSLHSGGHRFVPPPPLTEGGEFMSVPVLPLLHRLGVRKFFIVLAAVLCECRILFVSGSLQRLSQSAHAAVAALNPFIWQHAFIPILPAKLLDRVAAPMQFIIGIGKSLLSAVEKMPLSEVMIVNLDDNLVFMSSGSFPPLMCPARSDSSRVTATKKIQKSYGKALNKIREKFVIDDVPNDSSNSDHHQCGHERSSHLMENLLMEVKTVYDRTDKKSMVEDSYGSITRDDVDLKKALMAFYFCVFGDPKMLFPNQAAAVCSISENQQQQQLRFYQANFISKREELGDDPPQFLQFLNEFIHSQMFEEYFRTLAGNLQSETNGNDDDEKTGPRSKFSNTFWKCIKHCCKGFGSGSPCQSVSYAQAKRVIDSVLHVGSECGTDSIVMQRNSKVRTANHLMAPLLERGSIDLGHVQIVLRKLSRRLMDSTEVQGIMSPLWRNLLLTRSSGGGIGYEWRKVARTLYVLYELLLQGPDNVVADVLGRAPTLFKIAEMCCSHGSSNQGHEAVQGLSRRLLHVLLDLRQLVWMRRACRFSQMVSSEQQQQRKEVERFPFSGKGKKPLDFTALHSLISDAMTTDGDCIYHDGSFQAEYVDVMGKPPPPSPPPRVYLPSKVYSDEGIWAEEESSPPTSNPPFPVVVNSDSQEQITPSSLVFLSSSSSSSSSKEEGEHSSSLSSANGDGGLELAAAATAAVASHEREEEEEVACVMDGWEALAVDVLEPTLPVPPPSVSSLPLVSPIKWYHAEEALGSGGSQPNDGGTLTLLHIRQQQQYGVELSPAMAVLAEQQTLQKTKATTEEQSQQQFNNSIPPPPPFVYNNNNMLPISKVDSLSHHQLPQNQTSLEFDNGGRSRMLPLNQQEQMESSDLPRTPERERLNQSSSMASSSSIGMPKQPPLSPYMPRVEQQQQQQQSPPCPYVPTSVGMLSPSLQQTQLRMHGGPTAHQKPYVPPNAEQQHLEYGFGHVAYQPMGTVSSSPFNVRQEEGWGGEDHSRSTHQQNLAMGKMPPPPNWQHSQQNVFSSGMSQQMHQSPTPYTPTALHVQQQQQQPYLTPTLQQLGQPPWPSTSVSPQYQRMPPHVATPLQEENQSYPQMHQQQNYMVAPASSMNQQHQFVPSSFVVPQDGPNFGEKHPTIPHLQQQQQQQQPYIGSIPSPQPAREPFAPQLQEQQPPRGAPSPQSARPKQVRPARPSLPAKF